MVEVIKVSLGTCTDVETRKIKQSATPQPGRGKTSNVSASQLSDRRVSGTKAKHLERKHF